MPGVRERYAALERVLVGADFFSEGGAWRSLHRYYLHAQAAGRRLLLLDRRGRRKARQVVASALFAPRGSLVVNSLNSLHYWDVLGLLLYRRDAALYLHETQWMLDQFRRWHPLRFWLLQRILRRNRLLCASEQMARLYRERHGARDTRVVYECVDVDGPPQLDPRTPHIVMVGSLTARKGVALFASVARLAHGQGRAWKFHWVGGPPEPGLDLIPEVTWWGWRDDPGGVVRQARLFFLSSQDDPQPLAALEALRAGVPVVCSAGTGTAEVVNGLKGCRVFARHEPEAALEALCAALAEEPAPAELQARAAQVASPREFARRLEEALDD